MSENVAPRWDMTSIFPSLDSRELAAALGRRSGLPWWDLFAPVPGEGSLSWEQATTAVSQAFGSYSSQLARLAERAVIEKWIDAEAREGKRGGAFCMSVKGDESRVFLNFDGSVESLRTLAHELGHAYHNTNLAQLQTYGDALDPSALHPYMWAVKPHYYSSAYYNWPYCFGLQFGIGLYARDQEDPERFRAGYDDLLSSTGLGSAASLASRFGIDITSVDFWASSLDVIRARIDDVEQLVTERTVALRP